MYVPIPIRWVIAAAFVVLVTILSVTPGRGQADNSVFVWLVINTPTLMQKLMHVTAYALLVFLLAWTLEDVGSRSLRLALAVTLAVSLGVTLEWYQTQVPGRFGTLLDVLLNTGGALAGMLVTLLLL